jgi:hypothetical protein
MVETFKEVTPWEFRQLKPGFEVAITARTGSDRVTSLELRRARTLNGF